MIHGIRARFADGREDGVDLNGIVDMLPDSTFYWGEIDQQSMRAINQDASADGWLEATQRHLAGRPTLLRYISDPGRLGWLFHCYDQEANDVCVDPQTDPQNCGACGAVCAPLHSAAVCSSARCGHGPCEAGWVDCDGLAANGCENQDPRCWVDVCGRDANQRLVTLYIRTGLWDDAEAATDRYAQVVGEDDPDIPFFRGLIARGGGDDEEAVRQFDRFLELAPNDPRAEMVQGLRDDLAASSEGS